MKKYFLTFLMGLVAIGANAQTDRLVEEIEQKYNASEDKMLLLFDDGYKAKIKKVIDRADASSVKLINSMTDFIYIDGFMEDVKACYDRLPKALKESNDGIAIMNTYYRMHTPQLGAKVPDFTLSTPEGKPVRFYDYLKGKRCVLLDFWASWCGWCRKETPNVKKAYANYKDQGFDVISVSFDDKRANWEKALKEDQMPWMQVSDLKGTDKGFVYQWYGLNGIPAIFLIAEDGTMIAQGLRGDAIVNSVKDYLSKK